MSNRNGNNNVNDVVVVVFVIIFVVIKFKIEKQRERKLNILSVVTQIKKTMKLNSSYSKASNYGY